MFESRYHFFCHFSAVPLSYVGAYSCALMRFKVSFIFGIGGCSLVHGLKISTLIAGFFLLWFSPCSLTSLVYRWRVSPTSLNSQIWWIQGTQHHHQKFIFPPSWLFGGGTWGNKMLFHWVIIIFCALFQLVLLWQWLQGLQPPSPWATTPGRGWRWPNSCWRTSTVTSSCNTRKERPGSRPGFLLPWRFLYSRSCTFVLNTWGDGSLEEVHSSCIDCFWPGMSFELTES